MARDANKYRITLIDKSGTQSPLNLGEFDGGTAEEAEKKCKKELAGMFKRLATGTLYVKVDQIHLAPPAPDFDPNKSPFQ